MPYDVLPQRRKVRWFPKKVARSEIPDDLWRSIKVPGTVVGISGFAAQIEQLIEGEPSPVIITTSEVIEDASTFALEKHLEDFLVANWSQTELGRNYDIYSAGRANRPTVSKRYRTNRYSCCFQEPSDAVVRRT